MPPDDIHLRPARRWLAGLIAAAIISVATWKGMDYYRARRLENFLRAGRSALERGDYPTARAWVMRGLQVAPKNIAVVRLGAELEDAQDLPDATLWWARVVQLGPGKSEPLFAWAKTALRTGQRDAAERALQLVPTAERQSAAYHELMAGVALAEQQPAAADAHFAEAARLEPQNAVHRINLASLRLYARDPALAAAARAELEGTYVENPATRLLALRALLGDAVRQKDPERMRTLREKFLVETGRSWNDEILCLSAALATPVFEKELRDLEKRAENSIRDTVALADWLTARGQGVETCRWLAALPEAKRAETRAQISLANALTVLGDWKTLRSALTGGNWQQLDFLRRATMARAAKEMGEPFEREWREVVSSLAEQPENVLLLGQTTQAWGWTEQAESLFWKASEKKFAVRQGALRSLWILYTSKENTAGLCRVARQQYDDSPDDAQAKNNYAFLSLLLNSNPTLATRLAREVGTMAGAPPEFVATHAYALYLAGQNAEAVTVLRTLPESALRRPGLALYYALALTSVGEQEKAAEYAKLAVGGSFLPEEKRLLEGLQTAQTGR